MAILTFSGDEVAFFGGIGSDAGATTFSDINNPFLPGDVIEIEISDAFILPDGELSPEHINFTRITVIRDGVSYDFGVPDTSWLYPSDHGNNAEQGDTFFATGSSVSAPPSGPFADLDGGQLVFSTSDTFSTGTDTTIQQVQDQDFNQDGDSEDDGETGNGEFNVTTASALPCYAHGTMIGTPDGPRAVQSLSPGDLVMTLDRGAQPVKWIRSGRQALDGVASDGMPVLIGAGALAPGTPATDLIVSPQHRILVGGQGQLEQIFDTEAFVPAKALTGLPQVRHMGRMGDIVWVHFALGDHQIVTANGCRSESLLLGPMVTNDLSQKDRKILAAIFGARRSAGPLNGPPARPCLTAGETRRAIRNARIELAA